MTTFHFRTGISDPGLHVWREGTSMKLDLRPSEPPGGDGWVRFSYDFETSIPNRVRFMLFEFDATGSPGTFEKDDHQRELPHAAARFPDAVWCSQGTARVLLADPRAAELNKLKIHLLSQRRYRPSEIFLWGAPGQPSRRVAAAGTDTLGPYFDVPLNGSEKSHFNFKFVGQDEQGQLNRFEPDAANRLWSSADGPEIWVHSEAAAISTAVPEKKTLRIHFMQGLASSPQMHLWAENGEYAVDVAGTVDDSGWTAHETQIYTHLPLWDPFPQPGALGGRVGARRGEAGAHSDHGRR